MRKESKIMTILFPNTHKGESFQQAANVIMNLRLHPLSVCFNLVDYYYPCRQHEVEM